MFADELSFPLETTPAGPAVAPAAPALVPVVSGNNSKAQVDPSC